MKKRILSLLLISITVVIMSFTIIVNAEEKSCVIRGDNVIARSNSDVTLTLSIENNPGISGAEITVSFDERLTLKNAVAGEAFAALNYEEPSYYQNPTIFLWYSEKISNDDIKDGVILSLIFHTPSDIEDKFSITISYKSGNIVDKNLASVELTVVNGSISSTSYIPGDADGNGRLNTLDITAICRYISDGRKTDPNGYNVVINENAADVDGNGRINTLDITKILRYISDGRKTNPNGYNVTLLPGKVVCSHILQQQGSQNATCTEDGNIAYWTCDKCHKYFSDADGTTEITQESTVIKATGHKLTAVSAKEPACTVAGNIAYWYCADCGKYFSDADGTTEITHNSTIIQAKHTYSTSWSTDAEHHWYKATCGHNVTSNYEEHSFDKNNKCTVCGYVKPNYKSVYLTYSEIGKTIDLINGSDFSVKSGAKRLFSDDIYYYELNCTELDYQSSEGKSYSSFESFSEQCSSSLSTKIGFGIGDIGAIQLMEVDLTASSSYERKKESETSEYVYSWSYLFNGKRVEISEFRDSAKLSKVLSPDFINDAKKLKDGKMSAAEFVNLWGTHVITSAIYGARIDVEYYEISNKKSEYESYKDTLDNELNSTINQIKLNVEMNLSESGISTSSDKDTLRKFSVKGISKNPLVCSSIDTLGTDLAAWRSDFANNVNDNSAIVDIGDAGLCCIWYLLDDSFNDVKIILDEYMKKECSALYDAYFDKINKLKIDNDIKFDNTTGTLTINLESYQKASQIDGFMTDSFVSYEDGIIKIKPYYNGNQIKNIIIKGLYGTTDSSGQEICSLISNVSVKLESGDWNNELNIELRNVGIAGSKGCPALDLSSLNSDVNVTLLCYGKNTIKAGENGDGINANKLTIQSDDINNVVYIYGGNGSKGSKGNTPDRSGSGNGGTGNAGSKGGTGISASQINVSGEITVEIYGGTGGKGGTGGNSVNKYVGSKNSAGAGGTGGNGGNAVVADSLTVASESTLIVHGGNGGNGGNGGYRDTRYQNGNLGSGGAGGAGATAIVCTTVNGQYTYTNGANGSSGSTGGDWHSQDDYWNSAYWG